jgi:N-acetylglucosamine-6-phosphate deacetylase
MKLCNVNILTPEGLFYKGEVVFSSEIAQVELIGGAIKDPLSEGGGGRDLLVPGLVEIHAHGAMGCDSGDGSTSGLERIARFHARNGSTSFLATTMTDHRDAILRAMAVAGDFLGSRPGGGARLVGVNMEGPFLSQGKRGAHPAGLLRAPDIGFFDEAYRAAGKGIRLVSLAPELPGAIRFIEHSAAFSRVAIAHTEADYDMAVRAFDAGASHLTHLFNAMPPYLHRTPGVIGAAMDVGAWAEVIPDGFHLHPSVVRGAFRLFPGRVCLISDAIRSTGLPDGIYQSGGQQIFCRGGRTSLSDGTLAGSNISLLEGLRRAVAFGIPLNTALMSATHHNAEAVGIADQAGALLAGRAADMLRLSPSLELRQVYIGGEAILKEDADEGQ